MRMVHYYLALAALLVPALLATLYTGAFPDGSERHLVLGLFTGILCLATQTLLILFMIVSGRVLKAAMQSRPLPRAFLDELNEFFRRRRAYPLAILSAFVATAAAVLGYGRFIGVSSTVHMLVGLAAVLMNLLAVTNGFSTLRRNQDLLDRVAATLDRLDAAGVPASQAGGPQWSYRPATRWLVFAVSAWGPYLYWALVVWRGAFERVAPGLLVACALFSLFGLARAWQTRSRPL
jgi:hypothetical protein